MENPPPQNNKKASSSLKFMPVLLKCLLDSWLYLLSAGLQIFESNSGHKRSRLYLNVGLVVYQGNLELVYGRFLWVFVDCGHLNSVLCAAGKVV